MGKKYLKYALFVVGGLLVIVVAVVVIVLATFDPNTYKPRIVQMVKEKTGRTLAIQGNIGLAFFPKIGADVPRTTLSEQTSANEFAGVDRLRIHVALLPLLRKRVVVDEVRLEGLRANLVKFKDGTTNFSDLIPKGGKKPLPETGEPSPPGVPYAFDVGGVRILKSHLGWKDETMGRDLAVDVIELKTGRLADKQPAPVTLEASIKGVQPKIDLNLKANGTLTFDLAEPAYSLSGFSTNVTGSAMDISGLAVTLAGDIAARGAKPSIQMSKLNLEAKGSRGKDLFHVKVSAPTVEGSADAVKIQALSAVASGTFGNLKLSTADLKAANLILNPPGGQVLVDGLAAAGQRQDGTRRPGCQSLRAQARGQPRTGERAAGRAPCEPARCGSKGGGCAETFGDGRLSQGAQDLGAATECRREPERQRGERDVDDPHHGKCAGQDFRAAENRRRLHRERPPNSTENDEVVPLRVGARGFRKRRHLRQSANESGPEHY